MSKQFVNPFTGEVENAFCPTGQGGGRDPTCSPGKGGGTSLDGAKLSKHMSRVSRTFDLSGSDLREMETFIDRQIRRKSKGQEVAADTMEGLTEFWIKRAIDESPGSLGATGKMIRKGWAK